MHLLLRKIWPTNKRRTLRWTLNSVICWKTVSYPISWVTLTAPQAQRAEGAEETSTGWWLQFWNTIPTHGSEIGFECPVCLGSNYHPEVRRYSSEDLRNPWVTWNQDRECDYLGCDFALHSFTVQVSPSNKTQDFLIELDSRNRVPILTASS
jgi:hypothetical protein